MASENATLLEKIKHLFAAREEEFNAIYENPYAFAVLGTLYTFLIALPLAFNDPEKSFDQQLDTNAPGESCRVGMLTDNDHAPGLIALIFTVEFALLCFAIRIRKLRERYQEGRQGGGRGGHHRHRRQQPEPDPEHPTQEHPAEPVEWGNAHLALSAFASLFCFRRLARDEQMKMIIIIYMWMAHLLSVAPVFVLGPPGIGAFVTSVVIETLLFEPEEHNTNAPYQLEDTGALARIELYIAFVTTFLVGKETMLKGFILGTICWQFGKRRLRDKRWKRALHQGIDRTLLIMGAIFLGGSDCPVNSALYALILTVSPAQLVSQVHILLLWAYVLLLAPLGRWTGGACVRAVVCLGRCARSLPETWLVLCALWERLKSIAVARRNANEPRGWAAAAGSAAIGSLQEVRVEPRQDTGEAGTLPNGEETEPASAYYSIRTGRRVQSVY